MADIGANTEQIQVDLGIYNEVTEEFTPFTNTHTANVLRRCSNYEVLLTWLNNLGAWEYWGFQGNTSYGYDIESSQEADRSSFEDWDANFTQAETERFFADVKARIQRVFRAVDLTQEQAEALGTIAYSIAVQEFIESGGKQTVLVEKSSKEIRTEQEKLIDLEFEVRNTQRIAIQRQ